MDFTLKNRVLVSFGVAFIFTAIACTVCNSALSVLLTSAVFFGFVILLTRIPSYRRCAWVMIAAAVLCIIWQTFYCSVSALPREVLEKSKFESELRVCSYSEETDRNNITFRAEILCGGLRKPQVIVNTDAVPNNLRPGDVITAVISINELDEEGFPSQKSYYRSRGVSAFAYAKNIRLSRRADTVPLRFIPEYLSNQFKNKMDSLYDADTSAFLRSLILGDKSKLSDADYNNLRRTGMLHAMAVSGLHISLIAGLLIKILRKHKLRLIIIPIIFLFGLIVGAPQSAMRAVIMQSMIIIAPLLKREYDPLTALFTAGILLVAQNPYCASDAGFLLSFSATFGIIVFSGKIYSAIISGIQIKNRRIKRILLGLCATISVSLSAGVFTFPILCYTYASVSIIAPFSNMILDTFITLAFTFGIIGTILGIVCTPLAKLFGVGTAAVCKTARVISSWLASIPFAEIYTGSPSWIILSLYIIVMFIAVFIFGTDRIRRSIICIGASVAVCAGIAISANSAATAEQDKVRFDVLDVGQGECVYITHGHDCVIVDCGGSKDACNAVRAQMLKLGVDKIDALIFTHMHDDHTNGAKRLIGISEVEKIYIPEADRTSEGTHKILGSASDKDVVYVDEDTELEVGEIKVKMMVFQDDEYEYSDDENENGMVVIVGTDDYKTMITGDLPSDYEYEILDEVPDCNAFVAGHHGADTSNSLAFLDKILPEIVVVSVGKDNNYGHPSDSTLCRFKNIGSTVYRTDLDGTVTFVSG